MVDLVPPEAFCEAIVLKVPAHQSEQLWVHVREHDLLRAAAAAAVAAVADSQRRRQRRKPDARSELDHLHNSSILTTKFLFLLHNSSF